MRTILIPPSLQQALESEAAARGQTLEEVVSEMLTEATRMRRVPGIVFSDGPAGRRASIAGTGLDVWELVAAWKSEGEDFGRLAANYPWLTESQLRAALRFYETYPDEIDARLAREERWTAERVRGDFPFLAPRRHPS